MMEGYLSIFDRAVGGQHFLEISVLWDPCCICRERNSIMKLCCCSEVTVKLQYAVMFPAEDCYFVNIGFVPFIKYCTNNKGEVSGSPSITFYLVLAPLSMPQCFLF